MADKLSPGAAADMADTGQWRLEAVISRYGLRARLHAIGRPGVTERTIIDASWKEDEEGLLQRIENAVYDHPQVLEDYSARIIIDTPLTLWVPADRAQHEEERERIFTSVYGGSAEDILCDEPTGTAPVALYYLTPGLKAFLNRTFPGARILSGQSVVLEQALRLFPDGEGILTVIRPEATDIAAVSGGKLAAIATRPAMCAPDVTYHTLNTLNNLGFDPASTKVAVTGPDEAAVVEAKAQIAPFVSNTILLPDFDNTGLL